MLALTQRARTLLSDARAFQRGAFPSTQRLALQTDWHTYFNDMNCVADRTRLAPADLVFAAQCVSLYHEHIEQLRDTATIQSLLVAWAHLVVVASQHTPESAVYWPTDTEWTRLRLLLATVYTTFFDVGDATLSDFRHRLEQDHILIEEYDVDPALQKAYMARRVTPEIAAEREVKRQKAEEARLAGRRFDRDAFGQESEEAMGLMWRTSGGELFANFVRMASRVCHVVEYQNSIHARYPSEKAPAFTQGTYQALCVWLTGRVAIEQTEEFTAKFRAYAATSMHPMGASTQRFRSRHTRDSGTGANQVLGAELGAELSRSLGARLLVPLPKNTFWEPLFVTMLDFVMEQTSRLQWQKLYVFDNVEEALPRMEAEHYHGDEKRPILVKCQRVWRAFYQDKWILCDSLTHAVLVWLMLVERDFDNRLENTEDMEPVRQMMQLPRLNIPK